MFFEGGCYQTLLHCDLSRKIQVILVALMGLRGAQILILKMKSFNIKPQCVIRWGNTL